MENLKWSLGYQSCFAVNSKGRSGGLGVFWNNNVDFTVKSFSKYHIDSVVTEKDKPPWRLTMMYGEANRSLRHKTCDLMEFLSSESSLPWMCIGDFNGF